MADYRYTECGLDNVYIRGMRVLTDEAGEDVYGVTNPRGLHRAIAGGVVMKKQGISGAELRFLRTEMGMTQAELATVVKRDHQTIGRWEREESPMDEAAEVIIRLLATEKLDMEGELSIEEVAERCVPSAKQALIEIDGRDPTNYQLLAAA